MQVRTQALVIVRQVWYLFLLNVVVVSVLAPLRSRSSKDSRPSHGPSSALHESMQQLVKAVWPVELFVSTNAPPEIRARMTASLL